MTLITSLRVLGYVFNPASFFLCRDARGILRVVIVEVHNTFGERHLYTLRPEREGDPLRGLDGEGVLRVTVHRDGGPVHGARPRRSRGRAHRDQRAEGRGAGTEREPRPAPEAADRSNAGPDAGAPPAAVPPHDGPDPAGTPCASGRGAPSSFGTGRSRDERWCGCDAAPECALGSRADRFVERVARRVMLEPPRGGSGSDA